jgi:hypothetical protein
MSEAVNEPILEERIRLNRKGYSLIGRHYIQYSRFLLDLIRILYSASRAVKHKTAISLYDSQIPQINPINILMNNESFREQGGLPKRTRFILIVVTEKEGLSEYEYEFYGKKEDETSNNGKILLISDDKTSRETAEEVSDKFDAPDSFDEVKIKLLQQTYGAIVVERLAEGCYVSGSEIRYSRLFSEEFISELRVGRYGFANFDTGVIGYYQLNFRRSFGEDHRVIARGCSRDDLEKILQVAEENNLLSDDETTEVKKEETNPEHLIFYSLLAA